jgi:SAM-dependent methyltransferase
MHKQVDKSHYKFVKYFSKSRWDSIWNQLYEVINLNPERVLEIGPGPGLFKAAATALAVSVETLDIDPELQPDHVASVFEMPFEDGNYDVVCAFQMLEHLPYEQSLLAFKEMCRVANTHVVISLPDASRGWPQTLTIPKIGRVSFFVPRLRLRLQEHKFDGEHYWEINKAGYALKKIITDLIRSGEVELMKTFRTTENSYHRFFVFKVVRIKEKFKCDVQKDQSLEVAE